MALSSQIGPDLNTYETGFTPGARGDVGLTTIFTPPSTCLDVVTYDGTSLWQGGLLQTGDQDCYPPRFLDIFWSQYTPGICPHGWTSLAGQGAIVQSDGNIGTKAFCCPSVSVSRLVGRKDPRAKALEGILPLFHGRGVPPECVRQCFWFAPDQRVFNFDQRRRPNPSGCGFNHSRSSSRR